MLRFPCKSSAAALHLITESLEYAVFFAEMCDAADWQAQDTRVSRCFSRELAAPTMKATLHHLELDAVYQVSDYHWLLLQDAIDTLADITGCDSECDFLDVFLLWQQRRTRGLLASAAGA